MKYIILLLFIFTYISNADNISISGKVVDNATGEPIPGATIRIVNSNNGSYSSAYGNFKQPLPNGFNKVKFSSFGYFPKTLEFNESQSNLIISLVADTINLKGVEVIGDINADNIIKRAIERKQSNKSNIKTLKGLLYSKFVLELGGSIAGSSSSVGNTLNMMFSNDDADASDQFYVLESFAEQYMDLINKRSYSKIIRRRQTKNLSPDQNIISLTTFRSFYDNEMEIAETKIISPLHDNALNYYKYELIDKAVIDDKFVYNIKVIPNTSLFPTFEGTIKIIENTYNLYEVNLKPSDKTSIPFARDLTYLQKFQEVEEGIWYPAFLEVTAKVEIDVIKTIIDAEIDLKATSILSDIQANIELPDSLFKSNIKEITKVAPSADSLDMTFWENNSLRQIEPRELEIYEQVDSAVVKSSGVNDSTTVITDSGFLSFMPYFQYNRVSSYVFGLLPTFTFSEKFWINTKAAYSYGQINKDSEWLGNIQLNYSPFKHNRLLFNIKSYRDFEPMAINLDYPMILNTLTSFFGYDYYDYYLNEGLKAGFDYHWNMLSFSADIAYERHYTQENRTNFYFFKEEGFRENPSIRNGEYYYSELHTIIGEMPFFTLGKDIFYQVDVHLMAISSEFTDNVYPLAELRSSFSIPLFDLGYNPFRFEFDLDAGYADPEMYREFQFKMRTKVSVLGRRNAFLTSDISEFGGTEYYALHAGLNITDIWWRWLRLPTYNNRGLDLTIVASTGNYKHYGDSFYKETKSDHYSEVGFRLQRIPLFISNVAFLELKAKWGIGNLASGKFGWALSANLPF